jgi:hypothetical protein
MFARIGVMRALNRLSECSIRTGKIIIWAAESWRGMDKFGRLATLLALAS